MKKFLVRLVQMAVGGLFIFSGLVKMNDPVGFGFKLEEYFSETVLNIPFLEPFSLQLAVLLVIVEVLLGAALIFGLWKKLTLWLLTAMIVFFTFLTFWSAYFDQVTDCGCFGDAIPLTPWESFYKDVVLTVLIAILWWGRDAIYSNWPRWIVNIKLVAIPVFCVAFTTYVLRHLPYVDFRPYAEGKSIVEGMKSAEELGLIPPQYDVIYVMEDAQGNRVEISSDTYLKEKWYDKAEWTMRDDLSKSILVAEGYEPPVHDFSIYSDASGEITDSILALDEVWLLIAYNVQKTSEKGWENIQATAQRLHDGGIPVIALSASMREQLDPLGLPSWMDLGATDETTLKTIIRSNPGWVKLERGVVAAKYHHIDSPQ